MIHTQDTDFTLHQGDCVETLRTLEPESVHCCVTSPPYWGLRDYGTGTWQGGDPDCDHKQGRDGSGRADGIVDDRAQRNRDGAAALTRQVCRCGATKVDQQIGLEQTPDDYVARMVEVFREVRRVLRDDGTLWLNLGDTYANDTKWGGSSGGKHVEALHGNTGIGRQKVTTGLKPKDLVGIPWRVAFALQQDGWWLRSDIIWSKPNPMPESVTDRPTKSHEYVFLLSKSPRYFFDQEAVREAHTSTRWGGPTITQPPDTKYAEATANGFAGAAEALSRPGREWNAYPEGGRNVRSVWEIVTQPYPDAHFATFPQELPRRCIAAGTSERGCCPECGAPWQRQTDVEYTKSPVHGSGSVVGRHYETGANNYDGAGMPRLNKNVTTTGWVPSCGHSDAPVPGVVLDPFLGSGTTAYVARSLGRRTIGIELNPDYCDLAAKRMQQLSLLAYDC